MACPPNVDIGAIILNVIGIVCAFPAVSGLEWWVDESLNIVLRRISQGVSSRFKCLGNSNCKDAERALMHALALYIPAILAMATWIGVWIWQVARRRNLTTKIA
eukprot:315180_1